MIRLGAGVDQRLDIDHDAQMQNGDATENVNKAALQLYLFFNNSQKINDA